MGRYLTFGWPHLEVTGIGAVHHDGRKLRLRGWVPKPNKPMVPTAPYSPATSPLHPLRRHIGQPLDSAQGGERRAAPEQRLGHGRRTTSGGQRTTRTAT